MGLLIFVWDIYTELQSCMYQTAHGPCLSQSLGWKKFPEIPMDPQQVTNKLYYI
jgi:hypothetical protein